MHGIGNDFVVFDALDCPTFDAPDFGFERAAQTLCARHTGVGADGLLLLLRGEDAPVRMRMWNPDGTEDMCGNGLRCIARLAHARGYVGETFAVQTLAGVRDCSIEGELVSVGMGQPMLEPSAIPMSLIHGENPQHYLLPVGDERLPALSLSTGSTHTVLFCDSLPDDARFFHLSPLIEGHVFFPQRTSVMWAQHTGANELRLRIWERGAGETWACGTGACAAAVAAILTGRARDQVTVSSKGGALRIAWQEGGPITMTGPAQIVFHGQWSAAL